jgi:7-cyano-7-deazaguanine synthase in queuosine biosynthesis
MLIIIVSCHKNPISIDPQPIQRICIKQGSPFLVSKKVGDWDKKQIADNYQKIIKAYMQLEETVWCYEGKEK